MPRAQDLGQPIVGVVETPPRQLQRRGGDDGRQSGLRIGGARLTHLARNRVRRSEREVVLAHQRVGQFRERDAALAGPRFEPGLVELGGRSAAATSVSARAASWNTGSTSGCRSSSVSTMSPNGVLWTIIITAFASPNALLQMARACSSATGLRFCGMMLLPCTKPSPRRR